MPPLLLILGLLRSKTESVKITEISDYPWGRVADFTVCEGIKQSSVCPLPSCQGTEAAVDEMPPASNIFTALVMKKPQSWDFTAPWSE